MMQTIYLCSKRKNRKPQPKGKKKEGTDKSSDVDDGGWMRQKKVNLTILQPKQ
jgi:hypothetical protein